MRTQHILLSGSERATVCGSPEEVVAAAARMARRTRECVTVTVIVGHYHRRGCDDRLAGGYEAAGN